MKTRANGIEVNYELHGKAAHLANLEQPAGFTAALRDFLSSN